MMKSGIGIDQRQIPTQVNAGEPNSIPGERISGIRCHPSRFRFCFIKRLKSKNKSKLPLDETRKRVFTSEDCQGARRLHGLGNMLRCRQVEGEKRSKIKAGERSS